MFWLSAMIQFNDVYGIFCNKTCVGFVTFVSLSKQNILGLFRVLHHTTINYKSVKTKQIKSNNSNCHSLLDQYSFFCCSILDTINNRLSYLNEEQVRNNGRNRLKRISFEFPAHWRRAHALLHNTCPSILNFQLYFTFTELQKIE